MIVSVVVVNDRSGLYMSYFHRLISEHQMYVGMKNMCHALSLCLTEHLSFHQYRPCSLRWWRLLLQILYSISDNRAP